MTKPLSHFLTIVLLLPLVRQAVGDQPDAGASADLRNVKYGFVIPDEGYCDQPYVVVTKSGKWLCVLTTGAGKEGDLGQHVVSTVSTDKGRTWSKPLDIEPAAEASWVTPLLRLRASMVISSRVRLHHQGAFHIFHGHVERSAERVNYRIGGAGKISGEPEAPTDPPDRARVYSRSAACVD